VVSEHGVHGPVVNPECPAAHSQPVSDGNAKEKAWQVEQTAAPSPAWKVLSWQYSQVSDAAPTTGEAFPAAQEVHASSAVVFLYVPAAHATHSP